VTLPPRPKPKPRPATPNVQKHGGAFARPTPSTDPGGLAALAVTLIAAVFAAADPSGVLGDRWAPVVAAGLALVAVLAARSKAYAPATVDVVVRELVAAPARRRRPLVADGVRGGQQAPSRVVVPGGDERLRSVAGDYVAADLEASSPASGDTGYKVQPYDPADEAPPGDVGSSVGDCAGEGVDDG
jgi:hypothetical protein